MSSLLITAAATGFAALLLLVWLVVLTGVGALVTGPLRIPVTAPIGSLAWLGLFAATTFALLVHFVSGLAATWLAGVLVIAGAAGWWLRWHRSPQPARGLGRTHLILLLLVGAAALLLGHLSLGTPDNPDSLQYHLAQVAYNADHPVIPGLANLSHRLGFDSAGHVLGALLLPGPLAGSGLSLQVPLLCLVLILDGLQRLCTSQRARTGSIVLLLSATYGLLDVLRLPATHLASPSPDATALVLALAGIGYLALALAGRDARPAPTADLVTALLIATLLATVRPLFYVTLVLTVLVLAWAGRWRPLVGQAWPAGLAAGVLVVLALAHRSIVSGMPVFPSGPRLPVDWLVNAETAAGEARFIAENARHPGLSAEQVGGVLAWLGPWLARAPYVNLGGYVVALLVLGALIGVLCWAAPDRPILGRSQRALLLAATLPSAGTVVIWFILAPDLRFIWGSLVGLALLGSAVVIGGRIAHLPVRSGTAVLAGLAVTGAGLTGQSMVVAKSGFPVIVSSWAEVGARGLPIPPTRSYVVPGDAGGADLVIQGPLDPTAISFSCITVDWCASRAPVGVTGRGTTLTDGFRSQ